VVDLLGEKKPAAEMLENFGDHRHKLKDEPNGHHQQPYGI